MEQYNEIIRKDVNSTMKNHQIQISAKQTLDIVTFSLMIHDAYHTAEGKNLLCLNLDARGLDRMVTILWTTLSNEFLGMEMFYFDLIITEIIYQASG